MLASAQELKARDIEVPSDFGELFKTLVVGKNKGQRPPEDLRVIVFHKRKRYDFYTKHTRGSGGEEDFVLVPLHERTLKTIIVGTTDEKNWFVRIVLSLWEKVKFSW